jgi:hypothetical protein
MLDKSDKGIIFQNIDNQIVHVADAAFYGKQVFPGNLIQILNENFAMYGFPIDDPQFRKDILELLGKYELAAKQKPRQNRMELDEDFGKIV